MGRGEKNPSRKYAVSIKGSALRSLKAIQTKDQKRLRTLIDALETDPFPPSAQRLTAPGDPIFKLRSGVYRILFEVNSDALRVRVLRIAHRREVYERLGAIR